MTPDELLHERGWAVRFDGYGALEGPKRWKASGTPMGCIAGRDVRVDGAESIQEAAEMLTAAIDNGTNDHNWTQEQIEDEIYKKESSLSHLRWMLNRRQKGLDLYGIAREGRCVDGLDRTRLAK